MVTDTLCRVKICRQIAPGVFELVLSCASLPHIRGGQFCNVKIPDSPDKILRRPFCVVNVGKNEFSIVFAVKGAGTAKLSALNEGDTVSVLLPLGNGFDLTAFSSVAVVGGGIGVLPLLNAMNYFKDKRYYTFLGFRDNANVIMLDEFKKRSEELVVCTDDGSFGVKGYVTEEFYKQLNFLQFDAVITCGPHSMLKALKKLNLQLPIFVSMEERMACGVGACLVCACAVDGENRRVCKDGPVFRLSEVEL